VDRDAAEAELVALTTRRKARAVSSYIAAEAIIAVSLAGDEASTRVSTAIGHVEAIDAGGQVALSERITRNETAVRDADAAATAATEQQRTLTEAVTTLEYKLNSTVDVTTPVGVGRSAVAATANSADLAVDDLRAAQLRMDGTHVAAATTVRAALNALAVQVAPLEGVTTTPLGVWPGSVAEQSTDPLALSAAETPTTRALADTWSRMDLRRLRVMLFALQQVGKSYVWAAAGPEAYDCSGLMLRAYAREGVTLAHFSGTQSHSGPPVAWPDIQPTDLMGYGPNGAGHVTMHIGGGRMVEAKGAAYGVVVSNARPGDANARIG
jgi:cell wall-associated NlpC family hydrolase